MPPRVQPSLWAPDESLAGEGLSVCFPREHHSCWPSLAQEPDDAKRLAYKGWLTAMGIPLSAHARLTMAKRRGNRCLEGRVGFEPTTPGLKVRLPFGPHSALFPESVGRVRWRSARTNPAVLPAWDKRGRLSAPADEARQLTWRDRQIAVDYLHLVRKGG